MQTPFEKLYEMRFHDAAIWGAITFVRHYNPSVTMKDVLETFQEYFGMSENNFPIDSAMVNFYRTNTKIRSLVNNKKFDKNDQEKMLQLLTSVRDTLDEFIDKNKVDGGK